MSAIGFPTSYAGYFPLKPVHHAPPGTHPGDVSLDPATPGTHPKESLTSPTINTWTSLGKAAGANGKIRMSYSFLGAASNLPSVAQSNDKEGYTPMSAVQRKSVVTALKHLSSLANVEFVKSKKVGQGDLMFGTNEQSGSAGYAYYPQASGSIVMLGKGTASNARPEQGTFGWYVLLHEIGHAMGLKHPRSYGAEGTGGYAPEPYLDTAYDNARNTVMSYTLTPGTPRTFMTLDVAALQKAYGANTSPAVVVGQTTKFTNRWSGMQTIWAPKANGAINLTKVTNSNLVDMRAGAYSSINVVAGQQTNANVGLAEGSRISRVYGGAGADTIYANTTETRLNINGGAGNDTVYLDGSASDYETKTRGKTAVYTHKTTGQVIVLKNIETVAYYDASHDSKQILDVTL